MSRNATADTTTPIDSKKPTTKQELIAANIKLQVVFEAAYTAHLDYRESATAVRDKETDQLIFAEEREEEVKRTVELTVGS